MMDLYLQIAGAVSPFLLLASGGFGWLFRHEREKRTHLEARLNEEKAKIYHAAITAFARMFTNDIKNGRVVPLSEQKALEVMAVLNDFSRQGLVYAPKKVMNAHADFMRYFFDKSEKNQESAIDHIRGGLERFACLTNAIREDMGHSRKGGRLSADDLGRLFITDYQGQFSTRREQT